MSDPFTSPFPWGGSQRQAYGIAPDPPPITTQIVPFIAPTVGAISKAISGAAATTFSFGAACNRGDGIVLFVTHGTNTPTTVSASDQYGDTFNVYGNNFSAFNSTVYLLWLPICSGLNPTITVKTGSSAFIHAYAVQIVGGNSGWFIDGVQGLHVVSGTTIRPLLRTNEPNDLVLMVFSQTGGSASTNTAGYGFLNSNVPISTTFQTSLIYSLSPQASGALGPTGTYGSAQSGGITVSIRTQPYTVSQANPPVSVYPGIAQHPYISVPPPYAETTAPVVSGNVTENIGSQAGTFAEGTVVEAIGLFPTGQAGTFAEGAVVEAIDLFPTGLSGQFIEGIVTPTGGDVGPVTPPSQAGGTGKPRFKPKYSSEIFEEELARIEARLTAATKQREAIEAKLEEVEQAVSVPSDARDFVIGIQKAIDRAERRERARQQQPITVPVYFRTPEKSVGVERVETIERLRTLASIARHREEVALERVRKLREKIDEDAASYLMNLLMWEWDDD
jgi:hypothetical protein